jgi:hypothetical protein
MSHRDRTDWLGREDSNSQTSISKMPFEMCGEFAPIPELLGTRDFSRARCSKRDVHLLAGLVGWQAGLEPGLSEKFSDI